MKPFFTLLALFLLPLSLHAATDSMTPEELAAYSNRIAEAAAILKSIKPVTGKVNLPGGKAEVAVPAGIAYLDPKDTAKVLEDLWGNPKGAAEGTLGMLFPTNVSLFDSESWAIIMSYEEDGHVKDDDAAKIDYADLLKKMQGEVKQNNEARRKAGYSEVTLVGWAEQPRYDQAAHKMYWAKQLRFEGSDEDTLNYNIRVLGRRGVLVLNAVASMNQLGLIRDVTPSVLAATAFKPGETYADFDAKKDKLAPYGVAALVAGGVAVAAKAGIFKFLIAGIIAMKKFIIIGLIAVGGVIAAILGKKKNNTPSA